MLTSKLRLQTIALAHKGHLHVAIVGTKENLRSKVRWPCMDKAAEKFCKSCYECQLLAHPYPRIEWKQGSSLAHKQHQAVKDLRDRGGF